MTDVIKANQAAILIWKSQHVNNIIIITAKPRQFGILFFLAMFGEDNILLPPT